MRTVDLSINNFRGEISNTFTPISSIIDLNLESNLFRGPIPSSFSRLSSLESLRLQLNKFDGLVPQGICSLRGSENGYRTGLLTLGADCLSNSGITDNLCTCCTDCCDRNLGSCQSVDDSMFQEVSNLACEDAFRWDSETGEVTTV